MSVLLPVRLLVQQQYCVVSTPHCCLLFPGFFPLHSFGFYQTELEAAVAYDKMVRSKNGVTPLNFPTKDDAALDLMIDDMKVSKQQQQGGGRLCVRERVCVLCVSCALCV